METNKVSQFMHDLQGALARSWLVFSGNVRCLPWHRIAAICGSAALALTLLYSVSFFWPRIVQFSYSGANCFVNPVLLPGLVKTEASQGYDVNLAGTVSIGSLPLYSHATCVAPSQAPKVNVTETLRLAPSLFGGLLAKVITVTTTPLPTINAMAKMDAPVAIKDPLKFKLDQTDGVFEYQLSGNDQTAACTKAADEVNCNLEELELAQSAQYQIALKRAFQNQPTDTVFEASISTVNALEVAASSIANGSTVFGIPTDMTLTLSKPAVIYDGVQLKMGDQDIPVTHSLSGTTLSIHFTQPLARSTQFNLTVGHITAEDRGHLAAPFTLGFATSGGPKVAGVSIGTYKVPTAASITVTFDSALAAGQNLLHFVRLERAAGQMDATYALNGKSVTVTPKGGMPRCTAFKVKVLDGLKSNVGISSGSGTWVYNSRTICQTSFSIGTSVNGRGIIGYKFGDGGEKIVFIGALHGNERSSTYILNSWIDYLEANYDKIPAHRTVIIIPRINPDGYAANTRMNARSVDLNRNFPTSNWQAGVTEPNGQYYAHGGGTAPLSEPESSSLADYITSINPRLVMSYHAAAHIVSANEVGDSLALAKIYGQKAGYPVYGNDTGGTFDYSITGAFEDWLIERSEPCILVELVNKTGNEFSRHRNALLSMIQF